MRSRLICLALSCAMVSVAALVVQAARSDVVFRVEVSHRRVAIVRQSTEGDPPGVIVLADEKIRLKLGEWVPVRVNFQGHQLTAQVGSVTVQATHEALAGTKPAFALTAQGKGVGFRKLAVTE